LEELFSKSTLCQQSEPYDLNPTVQILSEYYKCQFFIFEGAIKSSHRLFLRYPENYDSSLKPIFLYKPCNSNHIIFIRNLFSYYRKNGKTCLVCKQYQKTANYNHFCKKSSNCCFVCHRYLQKSSTYFNSNLTKLFCDSKLNRDLKETCSLCNVKLYSVSCKNAHRLLCNSKGFFGYFCNLCQKFNYGSSGLTSDFLRSNHICNKKICKFCFKVEESNHLCLLTIPKYPQYHYNLCFLHLEAIDQEPIACVLLKENQTGHFENIFISELQLNLSMYFKPKNLQEDFDGYNFEGKTLKNFKKLEDLIYIEQQINKLNDNFVKKFLQLMLEERFRGTTVIVSDEDNTSMVSTIY